MNVCSLKMEFLVSLSLYPIFIIKFVYIVKG